MKLSSRSTVAQPLSGFLILLSISLAAQAGPAIKADSMGLSKASVFSVPETAPANYPSTQPGESKVLPRAYQGAPPQVPHSVSEYQPITAQMNMCAACHGQPALWGQKLEKGMPIPIPPSHYTDLRNAPDKVTENLIGARYNCNICHVPQTDAPALVKNTFRPK